MKTEPSLSAQKQSVTPDVDIEAAQRTEAARQFETIFVATVLKDAGLGKALMLSGGQDMEAFVSIYLEKLAEDIVDSGGFGISDQLMAQKAYAVDINGDGQ